MSRLMQFLQRVKGDGDGFSEIQFVAVLCQWLALYKALCPLLHWCYHRGALLFRRYSAMRTTVYITHSHNCRLRSLAYDTTDVVIDMIQHEPGGYSFWGLLPHTGTKNKKVLRKKIAIAILTTMFSESLLTAMLLASLDCNGRPHQHSQLYQWLLEYIYAGQVEHLYSDWLHCTKKLPTVV